MIFVMISPVNFENLFPAVDSLHRGVLKNKGDVECFCFTNGGLVFFWVLELNYFVRLFSACPTMMVRFDASTRFKLDKHLSHPLPDKIILRNVTHETTTQIKENPRGRNQAPFVSEART